MVMGMGMVMAVRAPSRAMQRRMVKRQQPDDIHRQPQHRHNHQLPMLHDGRVEAPRHPLEHEPHGRHAQQPARDKARQHLQPPIAKGDAVGRGPGHHVGDEEAGANDAAVKEHVDAVADEPQRVAVPADEDLDGGKGEVEEEEEEDVAGLRVVVEVAEEAAEGGKAERQEARQEEGGLGGGTGGRR